MMKTLETLTTEWIEKYEPQRVIMLALSFSLGCMVVVH
jgi:hypothetical protein